MFQPKECLIAEQDPNLTVGALRKLLQEAGLPEDTPVYYQRVGDVFFSLNRPCNRAGLIQVLNLTGTPIEESQLTLQ